MRSWTISNWVWRICVCTAMSWENPQQQGGRIVGLQAYRLQNVWFHVRLSRSPMVSKQCGAFSEWQACGMLPNWGAAKHVQPWLPGVSHHEWLAQANFFCFVSILIVTTLGHPLWVVPGWGFSDKRMEIWIMCYNFQSWALGFMVLQCNSKKLLPHQCHYKFKLPLMSQVY